MTHKRGARTSHVTRTYGYRKRDKTRRQMDLAKFNLKVYCFYFIFIFCFLDFFSFLLFHIGLMCLLYYTRKLYDITSTNIGVGLINVLNIIFLIKIR